MIHITLINCLVLFKLVEADSGSKEAPPCPRHLSVSFKCPPKYSVLEQADPFSSLAGKMVNSKQLRVLDMLDSGEQLENKSFFKQR